MGIPVTHIGLRRHSSFFDPHNLHIGEEDVAKVKHGEYGYRGMMGEVALRPDVRAMVGALPALKLLK